MDSAIRKKEKGEGRDNIYFLIKEIKCLGYLSRNACFRFLSLTLTSDG